MLMLMFERSSLFHTLQVTEETLGELKACFMEAYDDNKDGKIDIREVTAGT